MSVSEPLIKKTKLKRPFWHQSRVLIYKNFLVFTRNIKNTFFVLFTPVLICLLLLLLSSICSAYFKRFNIKDREFNTVEPLEKCLVPEDCVTVGYSIAVVF